MRKRRRTDADIFGDVLPPKKHGGGHLQDHRQKLVLAQAEGQRIKNAKMRGELLDARAVEAAWTGAVLDTRAALLAVATRVGSRLGLTVAQIEAIDAEIRDALAALAGGDDAGRG